jgi:hypothetical protein
MRSAVWRRERDSATWPVGVEAYPPAKPILSGMAA